MNARRRLCVLLALSLLANACSLPANAPRLKRQSLESSNDVSTSEPNTNNVAFDDENDDDFDEPTPVSGGEGGGSSIFSLLSLLGSILPSSSSSSVLVKKLQREFKSRDKSKLLFKRNIESNNVEFDYINDLKPPPFLRQEESSEQDNDGDTSNGSSDSEDGDNTGQESLEDDMNGSKENSDSNDASAANDSDYDSDEPPGGGDGQGGGLLGLLAGLSGGEDGQSDLGSLLATVSGIIANLSGDGIDLNALIASGIGLFVGLLSEGEENPGTVIASYLLTSLDTITGGGSKNNGAFFGNFLSKLIKGTSAGGDPDASSEEGEGNDMKDSAGFVLSFLMSLSGDMSKGSSASH